MAGMTLYEINEERAKIIENGVDLETGEVAPDFEEKMNENGVMRDEKLNDLLGYIKNKEAEAEAYGGEIKRMTKNMKSAQAVADGWKRYLAMQMEYGETFTSERGKISWRKSERVIADVDKIPEQFKRRIEEVKPDLVGIKKAIKAGEEVTGAFIEERHNIQIK